MKIILDIENNISKYEIKKGDNITNIDLALAITSLEEIKLRLLNHFTKDYEVTIKK